MDTKALLANIDIFRGLSPTELDSIAALCKERQYQDGEIVFAQNSSGHEIYIVVEGHVCIDLKLSSESEAATIYRMSPGEIFGEVALVDDGPRSATARCEGACRLAVLARDDVYGVFERDSHIGYVVTTSLAKAMASRLRNTNSQLVASILSERRLWY